MSILGIFTICNQLHDRICINSKPYNYIVQVSRDSPAIETPSSEMLLKRSNETQQMTIYDADPLRKFPGSQQYRVIFVLQRKTNS